jgi:MFS family permease
MAATIVTGAPKTQATASIYAWYVAGLLAVAHLISFIDRFLMSLLMEPLKADMSLSDTQLGLLQGTGFVILYTIAAVPLGLMADRVNRRNLIIAGIVVWSIATGLCGLANSFGSLFLARLGVGFGEAALVPAAMSLLSAYFPRRQLGRAVSLFTTGASLGKSAALVGGGAVLAALTVSGGLLLPGVGRLQPWQATFVLMAIPGLALALLLLTMREPKRKGGAAEKPGLGKGLAHVKAHRAAYLLHTCAASIVVLLIQSVGAWAPSFYARSFGMSPAEAGAAVGSIILVAGPLGHLSGGALTDFFLACTTFVGIGLGPPLIGFITDRLGGPQVLGQSLIVTVAFFGVVGAAVALASRQPFARTAAITSQEQLA